MSPSLSPVGNGLGSSTEDSLEPFGNLAERRERPIPSLDAARDRRRAYRKAPIVHAELSDEALVDLAVCGLAGQNHYSARLNPPYYVEIPGAIPNLLARKSVAAKLCEVNTMLAPIGLEVFIFDAFRPPEVQAFFHDVWMPSELTKSSPQLVEPALSREVELYWAAPTTDPQSPSPHSTGAAIDLTFRAVQGRELFMGTIFDDVSAASHTDHFELHFTPGSYSDEEARRNRRLLYWCMLEAGFANNPNEWWHYSWGDQMWSVICGDSPAFYASCSVGDCAP